MPTTKAPSRTATLAALAALGLLLLAIGVFPVRYWLWPEVRVWLRFQPTEATVTASSVDSWPGRGRFAAPDIRFSYRVGETVHECGRWRLSAVREGPEDEVAELVARHPPGSKHRAWYDPDDPSVAVLARGFTVPSLFALLFGLAPFVLPWVLWRYALRPGR